MTVPPLAAIDALAPAAASTARTSTGVGSAGFEALVRDGLGQVNQKLQLSELDLRRVAQGDATDLHRVMLRLEEARLGFQLLMQLRNRALEAYQDLMRMQV